jgi:hypothetical protein
MKDTSDRLIYALLVLLLIFGVLSFLYAPIYEKGGWLVVNAVTSGLSGLFGFKFGVHIPRPPDGSSSITRVDTPPVPKETFPDYPDPTK